MDSRLHGNDKEKRGNDKEKKENYPKKKDCLCKTVLEFTKQLNNYLTSTP